MMVWDAFREIRRHGTERHWWRNRFLTHVAGRYFITFRRPAARRLVELDWDVAVILDACRYDLFADVLADHTLPGTLRMRRSIQSATPNYLRENFGDRPHHDIVYVTANPYVSTMFEDGWFHAVDNVWRDGWDDELLTVLPETVAERATLALRKYPDKRLIIHFNQPHTPFVGAKRISGRRYNAIRMQALGEAAPAPSKRGTRPFERLDRGELTREMVWEAYRSNLERALPSVERVLTEATGRIVVTADHGNAFGDWAKPFPIRVYGHPPNVLIPSLVEVPYLVHERGVRPDIVTSPPRQTERTAADADGNQRTRERLRMLGYRE